MVRVRPCQVIARSRCPVGPADKRVDDSLSPPSCVSTASMRNAWRMTNFPVRSWDAIERLYAELRDEGATFVEPMLALTRSVIAEGAGEKLAAHTSMHDLVVTTYPVSSSPDSIRVSLLRGDRVRVAHLLPTGPGDTIERPLSDILPLFWRFTIEKWGIRPDRDSR